MSKKLPVKLAKDVCKEYDLEQVIVLCRDKDGYEHIVTYGCNEEECKNAGVSGDKLKVLKGWPDSTLSKYKNEKEFNDDLLIKRIHQLQNGN